MQKDIYSRYKLRKRIKREVRKCHAEICVLRWHEKKSQCIKRYEKERHRIYDKNQRDKRSREFYTGKEWLKKREEILLLDDGIDVYLFMTKGKIVAADTVHHIIPLKDDWEKRFSDENLMSLNHDTHSMIEQKYKTNKPETEQILMKMLQEYRQQQGQGESEKF